MAFRHTPAGLALALLVLAGCDRVTEMMPDLSSLMPPAPAEGAPAEPPAAPARTDPPSLASAHWVGLAPVVAAPASAGEGAWLAGPFEGAGQIAWISDTVTGLTVQARLEWRDAAPDQPAEISAEAAKGLGLASGAVANVAIYLPK
jgi:hypothetical protein